MKLLRLLRLCGDHGDLIRGRLRHEKAMKLAIQNRLGALTPPMRRRAC